VDELGRLDLLRDRTVNPGARDLQRPPRPPRTLRLALQVRVADPGDEVDAFDQEREEVFLARPLGFFAVDRAPDGCFRGEVAGEVEEPSPGPEEGVSETLVVEALEVGLEGSEVLGDEPLEAEDSPGVVIPNVSKNAKPSALISDFFGFTAVMTSMNESGPTSPRSASIGLSIAWLMIDSGWSAS
jgi:hypothetical protein